MRLTKEMKKQLEQVERCNDSIEYSKKEIEKHLEELELSETDYKKNYHRNSIETEQKHIASYLVWLNASALRFSLLSINQIKVGK